MRCKKAGLRRLSDNSWPYISPIAPGDFRPVFLLEMPFAQNHLFKKERSWQAGWRQPVDLCHCTSMRGWGEALWWVATRQRAEANPLGAYHFHKESVWTLLHQKMPEDCSVLHSQV